MGTSGSAGSRVASSNPAAAASTATAASSTGKLEKVVYTYKITGQAKATLKLSRDADGASWHSKKIALPYTLSETRLWDLTNKTWVTTPTEYTSIVVEQVDPAQPLVCNQYWKGKLVNHHFVLNYKNGSLKQGVSCD